MIREKIENWILKSDMKEEAIKRLEMFDIQREGINVLDDFKKGRIYVSCPDLTMNEIKEGIKEFRLANKEEMQILKEIQEKEKCVIYHIIKSKIRKDIISKEVKYCFLFVSNNKCNWNIENCFITSNPMLQINSEIIEVKSEHFCLNPNKYYFFYRNAKLNKFSECLDISLQNW